MKRVLITGINSFTGFYLSKELQKKGYDTYGSVYRKEDELLNKNYIYADLKNKNSIKNLVETVKADKIIHLAAISFVQHKNINEIYDTNLLGTRNLLYALNECSKRPNSVILASSANVYGNSKEEAIDEKSPYMPMNDYAVSKVSMELMANIWKDKLPITITRPFNYTGIGQSENFLIPKIISHFKKKKKSIELGNLEIYRDFSDVRDIAEIYAELMEINPVGETFNLCSGSCISIKQIIEIISELAGYEIEIIKNKDFIRSNEIKFIKGSNHKLFKKIKKKEMKNIKETLYWMFTS